MVRSFDLRPIRRTDSLSVKEVYVDAIESLGANFYTKSQIQAWASLAWLPGVLDRALKEGSGWLIAARDDVQAFALRYPLNRLALLYCRGCSSRCGYATTLIERVEADAHREGYKSLTTEASFFSYPLLLKLGWTIVRPEIIEIGGVSFDRFRMQKNL